MNKNQVLNQNPGLSIFILKVIAMITMTVDHVGFMLGSTQNTVTFILRVIGRICFPIIVFVLIEGLSHTSNIKKYILRLGIFALGEYVIMTILQAVSNFNFGFDGNIFLTLFLLAVSYYFIFKTKHKWLVIIPIAYLLLSFALETPFAFGYYDFADFPFFIYLNSFYAQYPLLGPALFFGIIIGYKIYNSIIKKRLVSNDLVEAFMQTPEYQRSKNGIVCIIIAGLSLICYLITYLPVYEGLLDNLCNFAIQTFMCLACIPLYFYNGKLGYNNKVVKYSFYLYYPLHLAIINLIFWLIS